MRKENLMTDAKSQKILSKMDSAIHEKDDISGEVCFNIRMYSTS